MLDSDLIQAKGFFLVKIENTMMSPKKWMVDFFHGAFDNNYVF